MKFAVILLAVVVLCCVGCANPYLSHSSFYGMPRIQGPGAYQQDEASEEQSWEEEAQPAQKKSQMRAIIGGCYGHIYPAANPVEGEHHINIRGSEVKAGHVTILFSDEGRRDDAYLGIDLRFENYSPFISRRTLDYGTLRVESAIVSFKVHGKPKGNSQMGGHFEIGFGTAQTRFDQHPAYDEYLLTINPGLQVSTGDAGIFAIGIGGDFYFEPERSCLSFNIRYEALKIPADWNENSVNLESVRWIDISHWELSLGFNIFF